MELAFESKSLRTLCESEAQARLKLGAKLAEVLEHRLADLRAATSPKDLVAGRPRVATDGKRMIVDLCNGCRIIFRPNHVDNPKTEAGHVAWERVTRVKILRIEGDNA